MNCQKSTLIKFSYHFSITDTGNFQKLSSRKNNVGEVMLQHETKMSAKYTVDRWSNFISGTSTMAWVSNSSRQPRLSFLFLLPSGGHISFTLGAKKKMTAKFTMDLPQTTFIITQFGIKHNIPNYWQQIIKNYMVLQ